MHIKNETLNNRVAIILPDGFADWEYGLLASVGRSFYDLQIQFFSPVPGLVISQGGLSAQIDHSIADIAPWVPSAIVVIGAEIWASNHAPDINDLLQNAHAANTIVAGICGGTLALARAGLLDGCRHTSNDLNYLKTNAQGYLGNDYFQQTAAAISEGGIITASGTAPVRFAAAIFERIGVAPEMVKQFKSMMEAEHK